MGASSWWSRTPERVRETPDSRGSRRASPVTHDCSKDPAAPPVITPRYLSEPADVELLVTGVKLSRQVAAAEPLARLRSAEVRPGPPATTPSPTIRIAEKAAELIRDRS